MNEVITGQGCHVHHKESGVLVHACHILHYTDMFLKYALHIITINDIYILWNRYESTETVY